MKEKKKVGIWIRVSTDFQVNDGSPENHEQRARYYVQSRDWEVAEVYNLEAISGKTVWDHPETKRMLKDIKTGRITGLVFSKLARLARNTKELLEFAEIFRKEGADLISLAEQIDTSTPAGRLFFTIISAMAQWEREEISSRVAASVPIRAELGKPLGGQASFGYKWENKQLMVDESEADVRKLIYQIYLQTERRKTTADELNRLGHRTRNGSKFSDTTVERLIRDTTAKGIRRANYTRSTGEGKQWEIKPKEEWVEIPCPAIVDEKLWNDCNALLDRQHAKRAHNGPKSQHLLSGIVQCHCGKRMYVLRSNKKFRCHSCNNKIAESEMNDMFHFHLKQYLEKIDPQIFLTEIDCQLKDKEQLLATSKKKRAQLRKRMDELVNLRLSGELSKEHMAELYRPFEEQVNQLDRSIPELQAEIDVSAIQLLSSDQVLREAKSLSSRWDEMEFSEKRKVVETVTGSITIDKDKVNIVLSSLPTVSSTSQRRFRDSSKRSA